MGIYFAAIRDLSPTWAVIFFITGHVPTLIWSLATVNRDPYISELTCIKEDSEIGLWSSGVASAILSFLYFEAILIRVFVTGGASIPQFLALSWLMVLMSCFFAILPGFIVGALVGIVWGYYRFKLRHSSRATDPEPADDRM